MSIARPIVRSLVRSVASSVVVSGGSSGPSQFITNGGFADGTNWTAGAGWSIAGGVAAYDGVGGGALTQVFGPLTAPLVAGPNYIFTYDAVNPVPSEITFTFSGGGGGTDPVVRDNDGHVEFFPLVLTGNRTTIAITAAAPNIFTLDNLSIVPA